MLQPYGSLESKPSGSMYPNSIYFSPKYLYVGTTLRPMILFDYLSTWTLRGSQEQPIQIESRRHSHVHVSTEIRGTEPETPECRRWPKLNRKIRKYAVANYDDDDSAFAAVQHLMPNSKVHLGFIGFRV